jgi:phosphatidate cytidylyltransferase
MGALLIVLTTAALVFDRALAPWYPFLFLLVMVMSLGACHELRALLRVYAPLSAAVCYGGVAMLGLTNWLVHAIRLPGTSWFWIGTAFALLVLAAFLAEMAAFREPGGVVLRLALMVWTVAYLGLLPCFLAQLRWLPNERGTIALALAVFVPKMGDTGAYFTGRLLGRHPMAPVLSPKKTWEGAAGGMIWSTLTAIGINRLGPALEGGLLVDIGFGLTVGLTGLLGDLAESLVKRDCQQKDASQIMPGFGGVLDVVDSIVFAAPVAYLWFV